MKPNGLLIVVLVVALAAVTGVAWTEGGDKPVCPMTGEPVACEGDGPHGPQGLSGQYHRPERMAAVLDLDDQQREAMREIISAQRDATRVRMETALATILTPEQFQKLEAIKSRREERGSLDRPGRKGRMGRRDQGRGDRGEMGDQRLERMTGHLDLTPDQQDQIRQILEEATPSPRAETRNRIREVLTPEQQEKMGQRHPQQGERTAQRPPRRPGKGRNPHARRQDGEGMVLPDRLAQKLQLSDEQREAAGKLMTEIQNEQRAETRNRIEALLTPEQQEKLEQLHP